MIAIKKVYEPAQKKDGFRVLIDRLWPRGMKKSDIVLDAWVKELAPSTELRKKFGHDPLKWDEFRSSFKKELQSEAAREKILDLAKRAERGTVTLLYSAHDSEYNNAVVLKEVLDGALKKQKIA